jgi:gluconate 2-dehydrogenase
MIKKRNFSVTVGYDNYDVAYLNQRKIWLSNTPHVLTETTADLAFTLLQYYQAQ